MDLFREKHTPQTECGPSQKARPACSFISCCLYFPTASFWGVNSLKRDEHLTWAKPICSQEWGGLQPYTSHFPETLGQSFTFLIMEGDLAHQLQDAKRFLNSLRNPTSFLLAMPPPVLAAFTCYLVVLWSTESLIGMMLRIPARVLPSFSNDLDFSAKLKVTSLPGC